jgi:hypothetical protein
LVFSGQFGQNRFIIHWHKQGQSNRIQIETAGVGSRLCSAFSGFRHILKAFDLNDAFLSIAPDMNIHLAVSGGKLRAGYSFLDFFWIFIDLLQSAFNRIADSKLNQ